METLTLTLRMFENNTSLSFSIGKYDQLFPVFENYSKSLNLNMNALYYKFDGQLIYPYMTPNQLDMETGDIIDVSMSINYIC
ncbi:small ubiquitin-related modifier 1 isoform X2 [Eurytemora carolleeae]|uniref:small ubiquitin-related modifier 1 isoform X2 n=1 Tax=Eurytemora carolleeae TaxID=1294199 RepID=UPI000C7677BF|nr:small ubiquitin-related modifier 1 isoform X2 [Eurytemora carolleeae]|eukprot:XP_023336337.1 small ubiquitin-related modifier 1-like isoform X2 [Eurytemora affinis]